MANGLVQKQTLQDIANAIRNKNQEVTTYKPSEMAAAINAIASEPKDIALDGNSYQYTTTGKNLIGLTNGSYADHSVTANVVDNEITLTGTATGGACVINIPLLATMTTSLGTLTKSLNPSGTYTGVQTSIRDNNGNLVGLWSNNAENNSGTLSATGYGFRIQVNENVNVNCILKVQGELGSNATNWEPYTGGTASPNPDYPQEVEIIDGINLFNKEVGMSTGGASKTTLPTGIRITQTTAGTYKNVYFLFGQSELLGKTITLHSNITASASNNGGILVWFGNSGNPYVQRIGMLTSSGSTTINIPSSFASSTDRIMINFYSNRDGTGNVNDYVDYTDLQIEIGESYSGYVPYGNIGVNVVGKNLFILPNNITQNGITYQKNEDGTFNISGTATANTNIYIPIDLSNTNINNGTYTISKKSAGYNTQIDLYNNNNTWVATPIYVYGNNLNSTATITIPSNITKIRFIIYVANGNSINLTNEHIQLEKGSTATEYTPYSNITIPVPLNNGFIGKINDYKDILNIDLETGIISKLKNIDKVVLDGSETWTAYSGTYGWSYYTNTYKDLIKKDFTNLYCLSNYFNYNSSVGDSNVGQFHIGGQVTSKNGNIVFNPFGDATNELANFKTWLGTHNTEVIFAVETPSTEVLSTIDNTTLTSFRNTLKNNGTLTIYSNLDPSQVRITYGYTKIMD